MKKLVWLFGVLFALSFVPLDRLPSWPAPPVVVPDVDEHPEAGVDPAIVAALAPATPADKARVRSVYTGLARVIGRDKSPLIVTTGHFATVQARTLDLAIDKPGTYPGLDTAIDAVFLAAIGTRDEVAVTPETRTKIITACYKIVNSAL